MTLGRPPVHPPFWEMVLKTDGCWLWTGPTTNGGYGKIKAKLAHRLAYEELVGRIPDGLEIDHLCRNILCVRPDHLEAVTHDENMRRATPGANNAAKTHCPKGHAYDATNTFVNRKGSRVCRSCSRASKRAYRARLILS